MQYTHVLLDMRGGIQSPADRLLTTPLCRPTSGALSAPAPQPNTETNSTIIEPEANDDDELRHPQASTLRATLTKRTRGETG